MALARSGQVVAPWSNVLTWRETSGYRVVLALSCGHETVRIKRTHRIYRRVQCKDCAKDIPARPLPPPAPRVKIKVEIRPDIHARFQVVLRRVEARFTADARTARRARIEREVQDDFGLNEYPVHLAHWGAGRIPPSHVRLHYREEL